MAKYQSFYKVVSPKPGITTMTDNQNIGDQGVYASHTWYQRLVQGSASRITRYREYDLMDNDVEIARSLDTVAEEMIGSDPNSDLPFELVIQGEKDENIPSSNVATLKTALRYWNDLHEWDTRLFKIARVTIKYGDCFFIRKKETQKWEYIHPKNIVAAIVDDRDLTRVMGWQIKRDIKTPNSPYNQPVGHFGSYSNELVDTFPAENVIWVTLNDDISETAPFGDSILRAVYRAQKQKEMLEDAIIISRMKSAPDRRVFYIDVGKMPPQRVKGYLEQIKNEIRQRKIPSGGGGHQQVDSAYNPTTSAEDYFFAQRSDSKGSRVETLPAGQGFGSLEDLEYFQWKVFRGLRIPLSYMREGQDNAVTNDGQIGVAYIQELRFAMYVKRLQGYVTRVMDTEFKRYLKVAGINIDPSIFNIKLIEPENFGIWRQQQLDAELLQTYASADSIPHMSKRFAMKTYAQMTDAQILSNQRLKCEEMGLDPDGGPEVWMQIYNQAAPGGDLGMGGGLGADLGAGMTAQNTLSPDLSAPGLGAGIPTGGPQGGSLGAPNVQATTAPPA